MHVRKHPYSYLMQQKIILGKLKYEFWKQINVMICKSYQYCILQWIFFL